MPQDRPVVKPSQHDFCHMDILSVQDKMTQVAERLSLLANAVSGMANAAQEGALAQKHNSDLTEEIKTQVDEELAAIKADLQAVSHDVKNLLIGDAAIQPLRDIVMHRLPIQLDQLNQANDGFMSPLAVDNPVPIVAATFEIRKMLRHLDGRKEDNGDKLTGWAFLEPKIGNAFWSGVGTAIVIAIYTMLKPFIK